MTNNQFLKFSLAALILAFIVIVLGAYVRLSDAGLGCPDWPGCFGQFTAPDNMEEITRANLEYPHLDIDSGKAWKEMTHRYFASALGLLIIGMAVIAWRNQHKSNVDIKLPVFLVALVIFQGLLGMWTVTLLLKPTIVTLHLLTGLLTLSLLCWVTLKHSENWIQNFKSIPKPSQSITILSRLALIVIAIQIFLGGWTSTNYVALYCPDFPTCQGQWLPPMDFDEAYTFIRPLGVNYEGGVLSNSAGVTVHVMHRIGALITFIVVTTLCATILLRSNQKLYRVIAIGILTLLFIQISLGIANVLLYLPIPIAVSHNAIAALLLLSVVVLNYIIHISKNENRVES